LTYSSLNPCEAFISASLFSQVASGKAARSLTG
jgi:hypothetical protein